MLSLQNRIKQDSKICVATTKIPPPLMLEKTEKNKWSYIYIEITYNKGLNNCTIIYLTIIVHNLTRVIFI